MGKIFGIGMPKTGTTSLHHALEALGFSSIHFPHDARTMRELENGNYRLSVLSRYDAASDIPIPAIFAQLDAAWPDSKFILTLRGRQSWLDSCERASFNAPSEVPERGHVRYFYRTMLYGCVAFNRERFAWVYESHTKRVTDHFSGVKEPQLLVLDITSGEGWARLCPFLRVPVPEQKFPNVNPHPRHVKDGSSLHDALKGMVRGVRKLIRSRER